MAYSYHGILFSSKKEQTTYIRINLKNLLSERRLLHKSPYCLILFISSPGRATADWPMMEKQYYLPLGVGEIGRRLAGTYWSEDNIQYLYVSWGYDAFMRIHWMVHLRYVHFLLSLGSKKKGTEKIQNSC